MSGRCGSSQTWRKHVLSPKLRSNSSLEKLHLAQSDLYSSHPANPENPQQGEKELWGVMTQLEDKGLSDQGRLLCSQTGPNTGQTWTLENTSTRLCGIFSDERAPHFGEVSQSDGSSRSSASKIHFFPYFTGSPVLNQLDLRSPLPSARTR